MLISFRQRKRTADKRHILMLECVLPKMRGTIGPDRNFSITRQIDTSENQGALLFFFEPAAVDVHNHSHPPPP